VQRPSREEGAIWDTDDNFRQEGIVMRYHQITPEERYTLAALRTQQPPLSQAEIARRMKRAPSTISRELRRNSARYDGAYRPSKAQERTNGRRSRSRRWSKTTAKEWMLVEDLLEHGLSPEQISGRLRRERILEISHETIYKYVWADKDAGGSLHRLLRQKTKKHRKRYATKERRGRVEGKRHISERSLDANKRRQFGHWEIDTVHGSGRDSVVTVVERKTGVVLIGKIPNLTAGALNARLVKLIRSFENEHGPAFRTLTADNGTEFHSFERVEQLTGVRFYFATPYHSWERGTNENTNGLIRQYLPKRTSFGSVSQADCNAIARRLNTRPRKRYDFATPLERLDQVRRRTRSRN
jgi:IS30 family transposase